MRENPVEIAVDAEITELALKNAIGLLMLDGRLDKIGPLYHELAVLDVGERP